MQVPKEMSSVLRALAGVLAACSTEPVRPDAGPSSDRAVAESDAPSQPLPAIGFERRPDGRARKWAELREHVADLRGWHLAQSAHYFYLSNVQDERFRSESIERAEEVRAEVRALFPHPDGDAIDFDLPLPVIRTCKDADQFHSYGGAGGARAYWSARTREIVTYDGEGSGGRGETWHALQGVLFNAYLDELHGTEREIGPWFEMGFQQWFAGLERTTEGYEPRLDARVRSTLRSKRKDGFFVPLRAVLAASKQTMMEDGVARAEAAGLVWYLLRGQERDEHGRAPWDAVLPRYYEAWSTGASEPQARAIAFQDVDALERDFRAWVAALPER